MNNEMEKSSLRRDIKNGIQKIIGEDHSVSVFIQNKIRVEDFIFLFQKVTELAVKELNPSSCKLLLFLLSKCQYQNSIQIHVETIMEDLKLSKPTVINSMKQLVKIGMVIKLRDFDDKRHNIYHINPVHAWKGKIAKRAKQIKAIEKSQLSLPGFSENTNFDQEGKQ